jgi:hypothetical protein
MLNPQSSRKKLIIATVVILLLFNFFTLTLAYPETFRLDGGGRLAKDFSAYYIGAWRMLHNPAQIYTHGLVNDGEPQIYPQPQAYKYTPSFLLFMAPFLSLDYHDGLVVFDALQFALLPLMALLLYNLLNKRNLAVVIVVMVVVFLPFPLPHWGPFASYFWQWAEGQAKVFETFLYLLAFYLGSRGKPYLSGVVLGFAAFDPRFALLSLPLFLFYNKSSLRASIASGALTLVLSNFLLFYPATATGFIGMVFGSGLTTPIYPYALIPLFTLASLIVVNGKEITETFSHAMSNCRRRVD